MKRNKGKKKWWEMREMFPDKALRKGLPQPKKRKTRSPWDSDMRNDQNKGRKQAKKKSGKEKHDPHQNFQRIM